MLEELQKLLAGNEDVKERIKEQTKNRLSVIALEQQLANAREFLDAPKLKIGDQVIRNKFGKLRYKQPEEGLIAIVTDIFESPALDSDSVVNGQIAILVDVDRLISYAVDLRFFEKVEG